MSGAPSRFTVEAIFRAVDKMSAPIVAMSKKVDAFVKSTEKGLGKVSAFNDKISSGLKRAGALAIGAAVATGAIVRDIVQTGAAFDKTLVAAAAKFDPEIKRGTAGFEALRMAAEKIGEETEFNAQQGAEALKALAASGFNAKEAIAVLPGVVNLATASEVDLGTASEMATKSLGAFGLRVKDTAQLQINLARVNDVMAKTAGETEASMEGLFESIKEGGPISQAAGQSMETFMAMTGRLARAGIEGSVAGTTLKNVFTSFSTKKGTGALKAIGVVTKDANGKMRDALDILGDLEAKTKDMGSAKRLSVLEGIFGKIPLAGVSTLLDQGTESIKELRTQLEAAKGSSTKLAEAMRDTVAGDIDELSSSIDGVKIALFSTNNPQIRKGLAALTKFVRDNKAAVIDKISAAVGWVGTHLGDIWKWMKRIGYAVAIFYTFSTAIKAVQFAIAGYEAAVHLATAANWLFKTSVKTWGAIPGVVGKAAQAVGLFDVEVAAAGKGLAGWREGLNAGVLSKKLQGLNAFMKGSLLVTAGLVGYALGNWLNETFGLSEKLEGLFQQITGLKDKLAGRDGKGVTDLNGNRVLADKSIQAPDGTWVYKSPARIAKEHADAAKKAAAAMTLPNLTAPESFASKYGIGGAETAETKPFYEIPAPEMVTPQERTATSIDETTTTEKSELTIKDETGRAEVTKKAPLQHSTIILQRAGVF